VGTGGGLNVIRRTRLLGPAEPLLTLIGYTIAALIGLSVNPSIALAIFLLFPILYVARGRSAEHSREE